MTRTGSCWHFIRGFDFHPRLYLLTPCFSGIYLYSRGVTSVTPGSSDGALHRRIRLAFAFRLDQPQPHLYLPSELGRLTGETLANWYVSRKMT